MARDDTRFLIDTNVFVAVEQHADGDHLYGRQAAEFMRRTAALGFRVCVSAATINDVQNANGELRARRRRALERYNVIEPAFVPPEVEGVFPGRRRRQDENDMQVLACLFAGVATFLVTNDAQLRTRARRLGLTNAISLDEALGFVRALQGPEVGFPPAVNLAAPHAINVDAPIFESLKEDYPAFMEWWRSKVVHERRDVAILGEVEAPEGIAVYKSEEGVPDLPDLDGRAILKICTFKVDSNAQGVRRGELLLKSTIEYARKRGFDVLYLEVYPQREDLVAWLARFGFRMSTTKATGELVLVKSLTQHRAAELGPLEHAVAFGPGSVLVQRAHVVPIQDRWHSRLLPEATAQGDLWAGAEACGNAIRKAYVCHAPTRKIQPGDLLLFMRTQAGPAHVSATGVVERTNRTRDSAELIATVGPRTVYSAEELERFCTEGPTLAILFRLDRRLVPPWPGEALIRHHVISAVPQSIAQVGPEGVAWLRSNLAESH